MLLGLALLACDGGPVDDGAPKVVILEPQDGDVVCGTPLHVETEVSGIELVDPYDPPDPPSFDETRFIPLEAEAGTLIVLHGLLPHSSFANTSDRSRGAFTLHVVDGTCKWSEDNWLHPDPDMPMRGFDHTGSGFPVQGIPGRSVPA